VLELELKAVVDNAGALRTRLAAAGGAVRFRGVMRDRRFDRDGELAARGEVLRVRRLEPVEGPPSETLAWKGPAGIVDGYKARRELGADLVAGTSAVGIIEAIGYREVHAIDRHVECHVLHGGEARLEWYPELDTLVEVEGDPEAIERIVSISGIPRSEFSSAPLDAFTIAYQARTGHAARLTLEPGEEPSHWPR
jgi:adenylate cyclase class IV